MDITLSCLGSLAVTATLGRFMGGHPCLNPFWLPLGLAGPNTLLYLLSSMQNIGAMLSNEQGARSMEGT